MRSFESPIQHLPYWHDSPVLSFEYYFLKVDGCAGPELRACEDWTEAVPPSARALGHALAAEGAVFTTQNFPVIETQARPREDLAISEPVQVVAMGSCQGWERGWERFHCYNPGMGGLQQAVHSHVGSQLYEAGRTSNSDIIVGFVPPGFAARWAGMMVSWKVPGKRIVLAELNRLNPVGVAHEFGHFFDLEHCPGNDEAEPCMKSIVGFRLSSSGASGFNKHEREGNQEADELLPVMHYGQQSVPRAFLTVEDYSALFQAIASAPRRQARVEPPVHLRRPWLALASALLSRPVFAQTADGPGGGSLIVTGSVAGDHVVLRRVQHRPGDPLPAAPPPAGRLTLDLLDAAGRVLRSVPFDPAAADSWHGAPGGLASFWLEVGAPAGLHTVRVTAPGGLSAARVRSAGPPSIRAEVISAADSEARVRRWSTEDSDDDAVRVDVYVRADNEGPWRGVAIDTAKTALSLDAGLLPAGRHVTARLVASDGFNTTTTDVDLGAGAPLAVLATLPGADAINVSASTDVIVSLSAPLRIGGSAPVVPLDATHLRLTGPDGETVFADVAYRRNGGMLILTPVAPLRPATRYTATLVAGLEDQRGGRLAADLTWSFVTAPASAGRPPDPPR